MNVNAYVAVFFLGALALLGVILGVLLAIEYFKKRRVQAQLEEIETKETSTRIEDIRKRISVTPLNDLIGADNAKYGSDKSGTGRNDSEGK